MQKIGEMTGPQRTRTHDYKEAYFPRVSHEVFKVVFKQLRLCPGELFHLSTGDEPDGYLRAERCLQKLMSKHARDGFDPTERTQTKSGPNTI